MRPEYKENDDLANLEAVKSVLFTNAGSLSVDRLPARTCVNIVTAKIAVQECASLPKSVVESEPVERLKRKMFEEAFAANSEVAGISSANAYANLVKMQMGFRKNGIVQTLHR
jgi:hypothetical protein